MANPLICGGAEMVAPKDGSVGVPVDGGGMALCGDDLWW